MPSFLIRGLARYFAASVMESRAQRQSAYTPPSDSSLDDCQKLSSGDLASWQTQMRWLLPFVQATGNQIIIHNPKSREQIIIDKDTKELPKLSLEWMQKYDRQKLLDWMAKEKEEQLLEKEEWRRKISARKIEEARGRARFGNSFTLGNPDAQKSLNSSENNQNYLIPILCACILVLALIGWWVYNSPTFELERYKKEILKRSTIVRKPEDNPYKDKAIEIIRKDIFKTINRESYQPKDT